MNLFYAWGDVKCFSTLFSHSTRVFFSPPFVCSNRNLHRTKQSIFQITTTKTIVTSIKLFKFMWRKSSTCAFLASYDVCISLKTSRNMCVTDMMQPLIVTLCLSIFRTVRNFVIFVVVSMLLHATVVTILHANIRFRCFPPWLNNPYAMRWKS